MAKRGEAFLKKELTAMTPEAMATLIKVQDKYSKDYIRFFDMLGGMYKKEARIQKRIEQAKRAVKGVVAHIGYLRRPISLKRRIETVDILFELMSEVSAHLKYFQEKASVTKALEERVRTIENQTRLSLEQLGQTHKAVQKELQTMAPDEKGVLGMIEQYAPSLAEFGRETVEGAARAMLGPFAEMGMTAVSGITGIIKGIRARRIAAKRRQFEMKMLPTAEVAPLGAFRRLERERGRGPSIGERVKGVLGLAPVPSRARADMASMAAPKATGLPIFGPTVSGVAGADARTYAMGMFMFFNRDAFKAKYTKEILRVLKRIAGEKSATGLNLGGLILGGGLFSKYILPWLKGIGALFVLRALGMIGMVFAGWQLGTVLNKYLHKKLGPMWQLTFDYIVEGWRWFLEKTRKQWHKIIDPAVNLWRTLKNTWIDYVVNPAVGLWNKIAGSKIGQFLGIQPLAALATASATLPPRFPTPGAGPTGKAPVTAKWATKPETETIPVMSQADYDKGIKAVLERIAKATEAQKTSEGPMVIPKERTEGYNNRDPLLDLLNMGAVGID